MQRLDPAKLILTKPEKGINLRKVASAFNFLLFWSLAAYVLRYVAEIFGWLAFYVLFNRIVGDLKLRDIVSVVMGLYAPIIAGASLALWGWAAYNRFRFGGAKDKRRAPIGGLTLQQVSSYARLPEMKIEEMRQAKAQICLFDKNAELTGSICLPGLDDADAFLAEIRKKP